jgi:hypothetical protein
MGIKEFSILLFYQQLTSTNVKNNPYIKLVSEVHLKSPELICGENDTTKFGVYI